MIEYACFIEFGEVYEFWLFEGWEFNRKSNVVEIVLKGSNLLLYVWWVCVCICFGENNLIGRVSEWFWKVTEVDVKCEKSGF